MPSRTASGRFVKRGETAHSAPAHKAPIPPSAAPSAAAPAPQTGGTGGKSGVNVAGKRVSWDAIVIAAASLLGVLWLVRHGGSSNLVPSTSNLTPIDAMGGPPLLGTTPPPDNGNPTGVSDWWDPVYGSVLGRTADAGGAAYWANETALVGQPQAESMFYSTPEAAVQTDYLQSLGRTAEPGGLAFWENQISSGKMTSSQVAQAIASSSEAQTRAGTK